MAESVGHLSRNGDFERDGRSLSRTSTWKRRDSSWDKKWIDHISKNEEELPKSNTLSKAIRAPGRLDNTLWEIRAASSEIQLKGLPPRTPLPSPMISRKNSDRQLHKKLLSKEKSYSRSLTSSPSVDFSTHKTAEPISEPVKNPEKIPDNYLWQEPILESKETSIETIQSNIEIDSEKTNGSLSHTKEIPASNNLSLNWKEKMQAELVLAKSLLHGKENVDSVIRLLEQTYEKLMNDEDLIKQDEFKSSKSVTQSPEWKRRSGTYEATLVYVNDDQEKVSDQGKSETLGQTQRSEFLRTMVHDSESCEAKVLPEEDEIEEEKMSEIEEESPPPPPPLPPPRIDSRRHLQNKQHVDENQDEDQHQHSQGIKEEYSQLSEQHKKLKSASLQSSYLEQQSSIFEVSNLHRQEVGEEVEISQESESNDFQSSILHQETKSSKFEASRESPNEDFKSSDLPGKSQENLSKLNCLEPSSQSWKTLPEEPQNITQKGLHGQFYSFEVPQREKAFSITGMWSNVDVGLVKERSSFWKNAERRAANYRNQGRLIDPSGWMSDSNNLNQLRLNESHKNKFISSGNLSLEEDRDEVVSSAMIVMEKRPNGRKSADIFVPSNYNQIGKKSTKDAVKKSINLLDENHPELIDDSLNEHCLKENDVSDKLLVIEETSQLTNSLLNFEEVKITTFEETCESKLITDGFLDANDQTNIMKETESSSSNFNHQEKLPSDNEILLCKNLNNEPNGIVTPQSFESSLVSNNFETDSALGISVEKLLQQEIQRKREIEEKLRQVEAENRELLEREKKSSEENMEILAFASPDQIYHHEEGQNFTKPRFLDAEVNRALVSPYLEGTKSPQFYQPEEKDGSINDVRGPPKVPSRSSSINLHVISSQNRPRESPTQLRLIQSPSVEAMSPLMANDIAKRAQEIEIREQVEKEYDEKDRKLREQAEQEKLFHKKLEIEKQYRLSDPNLTTSSLLQSTQQGKDTSLTPQALQRLKKEEMKELMKLKEMEQRKREIEEEIEREKRHLAALQLIEKEKAKHARMNPPPAVIQYERMVRSRVGQSSPPPPLPPPPLPPPPDPARLKFLMETLTGGQPTIEEASEGDVSEIESDKLSHSTSEPLRDKADVIDKNVKSHNDDLFNQRYRNSSSTDSIPKSVPNLQESPKEVKRESEPKALLSNDPKDTIVEITSFTKTPKREEVIEEDFIPNGVVKSAKDSLQRSLSKVSQKSFEKDEELKMVNPGTIKKVASAFNESSNTGKNNFLPPSKKIAQLFKAEYKKWPDYESDNEEDTDGYSEGADDLSSGLDLPPMPDFKKSEDSQSSGNVTPIPTQGELEEISIASEPDFRPSSVLQSDFRSQTPLKSLLKKQYGQDLPEIPVSVVDSRGRDSPHKAVHFSDVDQIKLMSLESLASTATSECSNNEPILRIHGTGGGSLPSRNQITSYPPGHQQLNLQL